MSGEVGIMQRSIKVEVASPVKPEVLKPSNTQNILCSTKSSTVINKAANNNTGNSNNKSNTRGRITSNPVHKQNSNISSSCMDKGTVAGWKPNNQKAMTNSPKASVLKSVQVPTKSPLKPLLPIRPSPNTKVSLSSRLASHSPSSLTSLVRTPTLGSSALSSSAVSPSAAATTRNVSPLKCRRRISYSDADAPVPVSRRNARERNRVKQVSQGFALLRQHVPQAARKKKMSKVETLRCAVDYIRGLQLLLDSEPSTHHTGPPPSTTVHSFHHPHHHHQQQLQQQQSQVFLQPPHAIEPHILKLPVADETFQSPVSLRYDSITGTFFRTSPSDSEGSQSPAHPLLQEKHPSPPQSTPMPSIGVGLIKTEQMETRPYGREDQDLLEALAWWQHSIQQ